MSTIAAKTGLPANAGAVPLTHHERSKPPARLVQAIPLVALAGVAAAAALDVATAREDAFGADVDALLRALTVAVSLGVGWVLCWRRPRLTVGSLIWIVGLGVSLPALALLSNSLAFAVGRIGVAALWVVLAYACLAHVGAGSERSAVRTPAVMALLSLALWALLVAVAEQALEAGLFAAPNPSATMRGLAVAALAALVIAGLAVAHALIARPRTASPLQRRATSPGLIATWALIGAGVPAALLRQLGADGAAVELLAGLGVAAMVALPACVVVGYVRRRAFVGDSARRLIARLACERPTPARVRTVLAETLDDPTLDLAFWLPSRRHYVDASGSLVDVAAVGPDRDVTYVGNGTPVAAIIHDAALCDYEQLLDTAGYAALLSLDNARLHADLRATISDLSASRRRLLSVADAERRRLERDLHDGAQQRLIALQMGLARAAERLHDDAEADAIFDELSTSAGLALDSLRQLVHGVYPTLLTDRGISDALAAAATASPLPVRVQIAGLGRFDPDVEGTVYFCCVEALQNAGKHAGRGASVHVVVRRDGQALVFEVRDEGRGFDLRTRGGAGLTNMRDRLAAAGGQLRIESAPGRGTTVSGTLPLPADA